MKIFFLILIKVYTKTTRPLMLPHCRFYPSCADYSYDSISRHGIIRGLFLSIFRISRCHPFTDGGIDPVPSLQ